MYLNYNNNINFYQTYKVDYFVYYLYIILSSAVKVSVDAGPEDYIVRGGSLPLGTQYKIAQLHFHWGGEDNKGSEHHVNGHAYPIEVCIHCIV